MATSTPHLLSLVAFEGPTTGSQYRPTGSKITVGRTKASKLHIEDETVSERHGVLQWEAGAWNLTDLDSSNGTAVNGVTLEPHAVCTLKEGDVVRFGNTKLRIEVAPVLPPDCTVEAFLEAECQRMMQRIQSDAEQQANALQKRWHAAKQELLGQQ